MWGRGLRRDAAGTQGAETGSEAHALPLGFGMVRRDGSIYALGCVHIGGISYGVWTLAPHVGGTAQAPQARGVYGLHRSMEYPTVADAVIEIKVMDRCFLYAYYGNPSASTNASTVVFPTKPHSRVQLRPGNTSAIRSKRLLIGVFLSPMRVRNSRGSLHHLHRDKVLE